jgi:hypothetical protein
MLDLRRFRRLVSKKDMVHIFFPQRFVFYSLEQSERQLKKISQKRDTETHPRFTKTREVAAKNKRPSLDCTSTGLSLLCGAVDKLFLNSIHDRRIGKIAAPTNQGEDLEQQVVADWLMPKHTVIGPAPDEPGLLLRPSQN